MRPLYLLLIEDDADSGDAMSLLLRQHGIHVDWVRSGRETLELFERDPERPVDVMLLDLMLPDMNSSELMGRLSELITLPPIVIHSAASQAAVNQSGRELDAIAIIRKPTDWAKLYDTLERCRPAGTGWGPLVPIRP
jgi:DNA-binding response OmpR family regulator